MEREGRPTLANSAPRAVTVDRLTPCAARATPTRPESIDSSACRPPTKSREPATSLPVRSMTLMPLAIWSVCAATMACVVSATEALVTTAALAAVFSKSVAFLPLMPACSTVSAELMRSEVVCPVAFEMPMMALPSLSAWSAVSPAWFCSLSSPSWNCIALSTPKAVMAAPTPRTAVEAVLANLFILPPEVSAMPPNSAIFAPASSMLAMYSRVSASSVATTVGSIPII